jgi:hypothetical protein
MTKSIWDFKIDMYNLVSDRDFMIYYKDMAIILFCESLVYEDIYQIIFFNGSKISGVDDV